MGNLCQPLGTVGVANDCQLKQASVVTCASNQICAKNYEYIDTYNNCGNNIYTCFDSIESFQTTTCKFDPYAQMVYANNVLVFEKDLSYDVPSMASSKYYCYYNNGNPTYLEKYCSITSYPESNCLLSKTNGLCGYHAWQVCSQVSCQTYYQCEINECRRDQLSSISNTCGTGCVTDSVTGYCKTASKNYVTRQPTKSPTNYPTKTPSSSPTKTPTAQDRKGLLIPSFTNLNDASVSLAEYSSWGFLDGWGVWVSSPCKSTTGTWKNPLELIMNEFDYIPCEVTSGNNLEVMFRVIFPSPLLVRGIRFSTGPDWYLLMKYGGTAPDGSKYPWQSKTFSTPPWEHYKQDLYFPDGARLLSSFDFTVRQSGTTVVTKPVGTLLFYAHGTHVAGHIDEKLNININMTDMMENI